MAISHKPGTVFNSPETQQWAVHGQPTCPISVSLFGTEFLTHFLCYKHQSIIYSINYHITPQFSPQQPRTAQECLKILHNSVPCFGTDQPPIPGIFSYQACILMQNFHNLKTQTALNILDSHDPNKKSQINSTSSVPSFGTDQTAPHGLKPTETSKSP